jgi:hypothetical protein
MKMKHSSQSGSVLTMAFASLAVVGVLAFSTFQFISGPVRSTSVVGLKTKVQSDQQIAARLIFNSSGNLDGNDPEIEPVDPETSATAPSGGGIVPTAVGAAARDPWGTPYGYCAWNHGGDATAGGNTLAGATTDYDSLPFAALISAGSDRTFQTSCTSISPYVNLVGDDRAEVFMYQTGATAASGGGSGGLWTKTGSDAQYMTDSVIVGNITTPSSAKFQVADDAEIGGAVSLLNSEAASLDGGLTLSGTGTLTVPGLSTSGSFTVDDALNLTTLAITLPTVDPAGIVENLNADELDGYDGAYLLNWTNKTNKDFPLTAMPTITGDTTFNDTTGVWRVTGLRGKELPPASPAPPGWTVLTFDAAEDKWEPRVMVVEGDVDGPLYTTQLVVEAIQNRPVLDANPATNNVLGWDGTQWKPMTVAMTGGASVVGVASGAVNFLGTDANITSGNCSSGHIPKYNGATWGCTTDSFGSATLPINFDNIDPDGTNLTRRIMVSESTNKPFWFSYGSLNVTLGLDAGAALETITPEANAGVGNTLIGQRAGASITTAGDNVAIGTQAMYSNSTALGNIHIGYNAGYKVTSGKAVMIGFRAGGKTANADNSTDSSVLIGSEAGVGMKTGISVTCVGRSACRGNASTNTDGTDSPTDFGKTGTTAVGYQAGRAASGNNGVYIGSGAGDESAANNSVYFGKDAAGDYTGSTGGNVYVGVEAGLGAGAAGSTLFGYQAMAENSGGGSTVFGYQAQKGSGNNYNVTFGAQAAFLRSWGESNIVMGYRAGACNAYGDAFAQAVIIGRNIQGTECGVGSDYNVIIGNDSFPRTALVQWIFNLGHGSGNAAANLTGHDNLFVGSNSVTAITSGTLNTIVGHAAGTTLTTGAGNILIGHGRNVAAGTTNDWFALGSSRASVGDVLWGDMAAGNMESKYTFNAPSDVRLKRDMHPIDNALARIKRIKGVIYKWREDYAQDGGRDHFGVIAQDLLRVVPEAVIKQGDVESSKYYAVSYESLIPLLVDAVNVQDKKLVRVEEKMKELKGGKDVR